MSIEFALDGRRRVLLALLSSRNLEHQGEHTDLTSTLSLSDRPAWVYPNSKWLSRFQGSFALIEVNPRRA